MNNRRSVRRILIVGGLLIALIAAGVAAVWFVGDDSAGSPSLPKVSGDTTLVVAGVAFVDNGDGELGDGDDAVESATVRLGIGDQYVQVDSATTTTNADGSFVLLSPPGFDPDISEMFVELSLVTEGPNGAGATSNVAVRVDVRLGQLDVPIAINALPRRCQSLTSDDCGPLLLPDLVPVLDGVTNPGTMPLPQDGWRVDTFSQPGQTLLRFPSIAANIGDGPLQVLSIPPATDTNDTEVAEAEVWQRVFRADFGYVDVQSGTFTYHDTHQHVHLDGFEEYRLLDLDGNVVVSGRKVSFCLMDSLRLNEFERPSFGVYQPVGQCGAVEQSINVGWTDYYGADLPDQWIDVTGVPAGDYLVEIVVDPDNVLLETNEDNNSVRFQVTLP